MFVVVPLDIVKSTLAGFGYAFLGQPAVATVKTNKLCERQVLMLPLAWACHFQNKINRVCSGSLEVHASGRKRRPNLQNFEITLKFIKVEWPLKMHGKSDKYK